MMGRATHSDETPTVKNTGSLLASARRQLLLRPRLDVSTVVVVITDVHSSSFLCSTQISTRDMTQSHLISSRLCSVWNAVAVPMFVLQEDLWASTTNSAKRS